MTPTEFYYWLRQNPQYWTEVNDPLWDRKGNEKFSSPELPHVYQDFLKQVGPISLFDGTLIFIGPQEIAAISSSMRSLNQPEERIYFDHLIPFCDRTANQWYFCFNGERIVEFDPLDPFSIETNVASSFQEFLSQVVLTKRA